MLIIPKAIDALSPSHAWSPLIQLSLATFKILLIISLPLTAYTHTLHHFHIKYPKLSLRKSSI
ncbi:hypothetical protein CC78DRAFT_364910 [Lojkania enalia]|uniref:Uncharacterized protein n=1 Tax=Lojkania enalia TaxID=147567 RepID=A0A9P4K2T3_9PLEO|nr:hypothetical protein CC78DRAFT_364910 [Didymosphaeria enalia]